jgi:glycosyltransferase involved in cell wall biosynthesis
MLITVIVCTYNRCQVLAEALESIAASVMPSDVEWEVLVVDNNSSDRTHEVIERFRNQYSGRFRYLLEPRQGLSFARNAGVFDSRGDVVAFTDDDVIVEPTWLSSLTITLQSDKWAGVGGRVVPRWDRRPPRWLSPSGCLLQGPFVALDLGPDQLPMLQAPVGANMAFRKEVFGKYGGFRTDLGRSAENLLSREDSEFGDRLLAAGEHFLYEPSAVVYHPVPDERLNKKYLLSWSFGDGYSSFVMSGNSLQYNWLCAGVPLHLFRRLARWSAQWLATINPARRFECRMKVWSIAGAIWASHQRSLGARRRTITDIAIVDTDPSADTSARKTAK